MKFSAAYVATAGIHLADVSLPNSYGGASPAFAPYHAIQFRRPADSGVRPRVLDGKRIAFQL